MLKYICLSDIFLNIDKKQRASANGNISGSPFLCISKNVNLTGSKG